MIRGSDGLDYENLTEKFLSNPAGTYRNGALKELRRQGTPKDDQKLWTDAYEAEHAYQIATWGHLDPSFADAEACCEADRALSAHRITERARKHVAERAAQGHYDLPATQDRRSPG